MAGDDFKKRFAHSPWQVLRWMLRAAVAVLRLVFTLGGGVSRAFSERINLAVCGVNECVYCTYLHTKLALKSGVTEAEAGEILAGDIGGARPEEAKALAYAQHFAESGGAPDRDAREALVTAYGAREAGAIRAVIDIIYAGNICSNTAEARRARAADARGVSFALAWMLAAPVAFFVKTAGGYKGG